MGEGTRRHRGRRRRRGTCCRHHGRRSRGQRRRPRENGLPRGQHNDFGRRPQRRHGRGGQGSAGIEDSPELHARQTLAAGDFRADPELVRTYTENVPATVEWLRTLGIEFSKIYPIFGGLWPRCRNPQGQRGYAYTEAELRRLKELQVPVLVNHKVSTVLRESPTEGRVIGVEVETEGTREYWRARKGVVACAGGFAANAEMCSFFDPRFSNLNTSNQPGATGEVLVALQDIGALATGLDCIQCIPGRPVGFKSYSNLIR